MTEPKLTCSGCGRLVYEDPSHYLNFCTYCLNGAAYFSIAREFSNMPAGVTLEDGDYSGERLRGILEKRLFRSPLVVDMDGTRGYGSSFLQAAFTALGAAQAIPPDHINIRCQEDRSIVMEVEGYIRQSTSPLLTRIEDAQKRRRREAQVKEDLYKACTEWDETRHSKEALVARILKILPDPNPGPWIKAKHKTRLGTYEIRLTHNGYDVRDEGSSEHESGVDPSYVRAEFVEQP